MRYPLVVTLCLFAATAYAADIPEAHDHPEVKRFGGAEIVGYDHRSFDAFDLQTSSYKGYDLSNKVRVYQEPPLHLEGARTTIWYEAAGDTTALELARNYEAELESAGFQLLYNSSDDPTVARWPVGYLWPFDRNIRSRRRHHIFTNADQGRVRALTAKRDRPDGSSVYVAVTAVEWASDDPGAWAKRGAYVAVEVIEPKAMKQNMVRVTAEQMSTAITTTGRATLYGILFDTNKAEIKPDSKPALEEIARLLKSQPSMRLHIVGHTDSVGGLDANLALSKRRSEAVLDALRANHGIAAQRLTANGVASLAPVATNEREEGRAKNRRVELVPQ